MEGDGQSRGDRPFSYLLIAAYRLALFGAFYGKGLPYGSILSCSQA